MNAGTRADHNRFCLTEKWDVVRDARGRAVSHHVTYELQLFDGRVLRTRISRPADKTTYGPTLWKAILRDQLDVTEGEFWACVRNGRIPERGQDAEVPPKAALPAGLVYQLIHVAMVPEAQVRGLTLEEALAAMNAHWSEPPTE